MAITLAVETLAGDLSVSTGLLTSRYVIITKNSPLPPFISCGKFGSFYLGKATAAARAALPIPISVYSVFVCPDSV